MPNWRQLTPPEQNELLGRLTLLVVEPLEPGWEKVMIDFKAIGRTIDVATGVMYGGTYQVFNPSKDVWSLFGELRTGMHSEGHGTWFSCRLSIDPPSAFAIQYNWRNEPAMANAPKPGDYLTEQERFPRAEEHMPTWFREHLLAAKHTES